MTAAQSLWDGPVGTSLNTFVDAVGPWVAANQAVAAPTVAFLAAYVLYGLLGKRLLGTDDDFWPRLRRPALRALHRLGQRYGLYAVTTTHPPEVAGHARMDLGALERRLERAGYLRQPLSSLHETPSGQPEAGSWARPLAPWLPVEPLVRALPVVGGSLGRFVRALDDVLALRQRNVVLHIVGETPGGVDIVAVSAHDEPNPLNPLTALAHYRGTGLQPSPAAVMRDLRQVSVKLTLTGDDAFDAGDPGIRGDG